VVEPDANHSLRIQRQIEEFERVRKVPEALKKVPEAFFPSSSPELEFSKIPSIVLLGNGTVFCHGFLYRDYLFLNEHSLTMWRDKASKLVMQAVLQCPVSEFHGKSVDLVIPKPEEVCSMHKLSTKEEVDLVYFKVSKTPLASWPRIQLSLKNIKLEKGMSLFCLKYSLENAKLVLKATLGPFTGEDGHQATTYPGSSGSLMMVNNYLVGAHSSASSSNNEFVPFASLNWTPVHSAVKEKQCFLDPDPQGWLDVAAVGLFEPEVVPISIDDVPREFINPYAVVGRVKNYKPASRPQRGDPYLLGTLNESEKEMAYTLQEKWRMAGHSRADAFIGANKYWQLSDIDVLPENETLYDLAAKVVEEFMLKRIGRNGHCAHEQAVSQLERTTAACFPLNMGRWKTKGDLFDHQPDLIVKGGRLEKSHDEFMEKGTPLSVADSNTKVEMRLRSKPARQLNGFCASWLYKGYRCFYRFSCRFYTSWSILCHGVGANPRELFRKMAPSYNTGAVKVSWDQSSQDANMIPCRISRIDRIIAILASENELEYTRNLQYLTAESECFVLVNEYLMKTCWGNKSGSIVTIIRNILDSIIAWVYTGLRTGCTTAELSKMLDRRELCVYGDDLVSYASFFEKKFVTAQWLVDTLAEIKITLSDVHLTVDINELSFCSCKFVWNEKYNRWSMAPEDPDKLFGHLILATVKSPAESFRRVAAIRDLFYNDRFWFDLYDSKLTALYTKYFDAGNKEWVEVMNSWTSEMNLAGLFFGFEKPMKESNLCALGGAYKMGSSKTTKAVWLQQKKKKNPSLTPAMLEERWKQRNASLKGVSSGPSISSPGMLRSKGAPSKQMTKSGIVGNMFIDAAREGGFVAQVLDPFKTAREERLVKGPCVVNLGTGMMSFTTSRPISTNGSGEFICSLTSDLCRAYGMGPGLNNIGGFLTSGPASFIEGVPFTAVPDFSDFADLYGMYRICGMGMYYTPINPPLNQQGRIVGFSLPDSITFPIIGTGFSFNDMQNLYGATVGAAAHDFCVTSRPLDYRAFDFHSTIIGRLQGANAFNRTAACGNNLADFLNEARVTGVISGIQMDQYLDAASDMGWNQIYISGAGLPPNTTVGNIDFVWIVEAIPFTRAFSIVSPTTAPGANDIAPAAKAILAAAPPAVSVETGKSFTDKLGEVVGDVQTISGNLGVPFLPQVLGVVKGALGLFRKK